MVGGGLQPVNLEITAASAVAVAGYDLMRDQQQRVSAKHRTLNGIAVAGSTAAGDCSFDLFIGQRLIGRFFVKAAGWPTRDHMVPLAGLYVPPGETVSMIMVNAPTTNPINVIVI